MFSFRKKEAFKNSNIDISRICYITKMDQHNNIKSQTLKNTSFRISSVVQECLGTGNNN